MVVTGPEGEQAPAPQVEPEPDRPAGDAGQIARVLPPHSLANAKVNYSKMAPLGRGDE